jgi:phospholipase C
MRLRFGRAFATAAALTALSGPLSAEPGEQEWLREFAASPGAPTAERPLVRLQPDPTPDVTPFVGGADVDDSHYGPARQKRFIQALRKRVKYVFVIFNENHSFDNEFGSFPGVNGLYSDGRRPRSAAETPGFTQTYTDQATGLAVTTQPFGLGPRQNGNLADSVDHSHVGLARKIDVVNNVAQMDGFSRDEYDRYANNTAAGQAKGRQFANLVMSHIDCETIPFFWYWASRFTIFDNIFATEDTPSTPNAVAMLAGQAGETQWVKHGPAGRSYQAVAPVCGVTYGGGGTTQGVPALNDPQPFYGSQYDATAAGRVPAGCRESYRLGNISSNLTFASLPLSMLGVDAVAVADGDLHKDADLADVQQDLPFIAGEATKNATKPVAWRWYQEGYDLEPNETSATASHSSFVSHHNGAQYFGYIANNPAMSANLKGLGDFFRDVATGKLPDGGVIYIRGGFSNLQNLTPPIRNAEYPAALTPADIATIQATKAGDDDHPAYSDRQITEALAARVINAVAGDSRIWEQSAIIITYDESDGFYDHVPPRILSYGPDRLPLSRGVRVPLILISPFARAHSVSSAEGDHNAVIETINAIFGLPALASLPDEAQALAAGDSPAFNQFGPEGFAQKYLGPRDLPSPVTQSLLSGFDLDRLEGRKPLLPASLALIPDSVVTSLPHFGDAPGGACAAIGVIPEDKRQNIPNPIPAGFNPLPSTLPRYN